LDGVDDQRDDRHQEPVEKVFDIFLLGPELQLDGEEESLREGEVFL
jgi:hypothetical protein